MTDQRAKRVSDALVAETRKHIETRQAHINHLKKNPVPRGWYWAQHRYWTKTQGKWLLIYVSGESMYLFGQTAMLCTGDVHNHRQDLCDFTNLIRIEEPNLSAPRFPLDLTQENT